MKKKVETNCACEMERKWNEERPRERCTDEVAGGLKIMGIRNGNALARDGKQHRRTVLEAIVHSAHPTELSRKFKFH